MISPSAQPGALARPRVAVPLIVALGLVLFFTSLGHPMYTFGEPREGVTVIDVVNGRGFILPQDPLVEMPFKPPMMRWLATLFTEIAGGKAGISELTIRMPSATLGIGAMIVCYAYGAALFEPIVGLGGALMLGTSLQFLQAATNARVDMTLTFFLEVAFFEFLLMAEGLTSRWPLLYLALAGAVLSKGPMGIVLPAAVFIIWATIERRPLIGRLHLVRGLIVVGLVAGGWYALAIAIGGSAFVLRQLINENVFAFIYNSSKSGGHNHSFLWFALALLVGWLPWSPFLPWVVADLTRKRPGPRLTYLIVWALAVMFFYGLAHQKRGIYLLAIYPALALLTASFVRRIDALPAALPPLFTVLGLALSVGFAVIGAGGLAFVALTKLRPALVGRLLVSAGIVVPGLADGLRAQFAHSGAVWLLPALTLLFGLGLFGWRSRPSTLCGLSVGAIGAVIVWAQLFFVPVVTNAITLKQFARQAMQLVDDHSIAYLIGLNYEFAFYSQRRIAVIGSPRPDWPDYLLVDAQFYPNWRDNRLSNFDVALESGPANLDGSGALVLLSRVRKKSSAARSIP